MGASKTSRIKVTEFYLKCVLCVILVCLLVKYDRLANEGKYFFPPVILYKLFFEVLLTVHLSIFISVINQLDAQNLFHDKFYFMPLHVSNTCAHHQEVKIALHSLTS